ncbi:MAG: transposase [Polyangiaceae bacterium]|nr:transposase [Polyangiaceae bacterium]
MLRLKTPYRDGTTHLLFDPVELVEKLAALVPRPKKNLVLYHGVLAANAKLRARVVAYGRDALEESQPRTPGRKEGGPNLAWAELMRHAFGHDVLECPRCGHRLRFIASIEAGPIARAILSHLGLIVDRSSAPARASPPAAALESADYAIDLAFDFGP